MSNHERPQHERLLSEDAFDRLIDRHGSDPARWPLSDRSAALALVAASPAAAARLDDARRLDRLLDTLPAAVPSAALEARILADAQAVLAAAPAVAQRGDVPARRSQPKPWSAWREWGASLASVLWPGRAAWQPSAVLGVSLAAGLALGLVQPVVPIDLLRTTGLGTTEATGEVDLSTLVFGETTLEESWP